MENNQNQQQDNTPKPNTGQENNNEQQKQEITPNNDQDNSNKDGQQGQGGGDKFRERESEDDHRDIPEIGEDEKEIERNTPRM
jgi:hypothetical protein